MAASPRLLVLGRMLRWLLTESPDTAIDRSVIRPIPISPRPWLTCSVKKLRAFSRLAAAYMRRQAMGFQGCLLTVGVMHPIVLVAHRRQCCGNADRSRYTFSPDFLFG